MNRLQHEKSPYLLQHKNNPVDWYPWGEDAFKKAKNENKMLFISIGYSTCHWCHVMGKESFEDEEVASFLNSNFVAVKVDREERPDIDQYFLNSLQALNQEIGWPLNMFVTSEGLTIQGGTYFPPTDLYNRPSFKTVLERMSGLWKTDQDKLLMSAKGLKIQMKKKEDIFPSKIPRFEWDSENKTVEFALKHYDVENGGFTYQPENKFPPSMLLMLLLRNHNRTGEEQSLRIVKDTLVKMYHRGIYDQIGGGLFRYSTDYKWSMPHFEKMIYDNALFSQVLIETYQLTKEDQYQGFAKNVFTYILREMTSTEGVFYCAEDADSEGKEGNYYLWNYEELKFLLSKEELTFSAKVWNITPEGNFKNNKINFTQEVLDDELIKKLKISKNNFLQKKQNIKDKLFKVRNKLSKPQKDDKIIVSWNALVARSFALAAKAFNKSGYLKSAIQCLNYIFDNLEKENGELYRRFRDGECKVGGFLSDYANLGLACLEVYSVGFDSKWLLKARDLANKIDHLFHNPEGPYFDNVDDSNGYLDRSFEGFDGVEPSGNSAAAMLFIKLSDLGFSSSFKKNAETILSSYRNYLLNTGVSFSAMQCAKHLLITGHQQVVIVSESNDDNVKKIIKFIHSNFLPNVLLIKVLNKELENEKKRIPILKYAEKAEKMHIYFCENQACQLPVHSLEELKTLLGK